MGFGAKPRFLFVNTKKSAHASGFYFCPLKNKRKLLLGVPVYAVEMDCAAGYAPAGYAPQGMRRRGLRRQGMRRGFAP